MAPTAPAPPKKAATTAKFKAAGVPAPRKAASAPVVSTTAARVSYQRQIKAALALTGPFNLIIFVPAALPRAVNHQWLPPSPLFGFELVSLVGFLVLCSAALLLVLGYMLLTHAVRCLSEADGTTSCSVSISLADMTI